MHDLTRPRNPHIPFYSYFITQTLKCSKGFKDKTCLDLIPSRLGYKMSGFTFSEKGSTFYQNLLLMYVRYVSLKHVNVFSGMRWNIN